MGNFRYSIYSPHSIDIPHSREMDQVTNTFSKFKLFALLLSLLVLGLNIPKVTTILFPLLVLIWARFRARFMLETLLLLMFSISYYFISAYYRVIPFDVAVKYTVITPSAYLLGAYIRWDRLSFWPYNTILAVEAIGMGFVLFSFFSFRYTMSHYGYLISDRQFVSIWTGEATNGIGLATYSGALIALVPASMVGLTRLWRGKSPLFTRVFLGLVFCSVIVMGTLGGYINAYMQNRGFLLMFFLVCTIVFIYYFCRQNFITFLTAIMISLVVSIIFYYILINFIDINRSANILSYRLNAAKFHTPRFHLWIEGLKNIFENPWGNTKINYKLLGGELYYHNLWLDIVRVSGIIPVLFLLAFQLKHVRSVFIILRKSEYPLLEISIISITIFIIFIYQCEPVMDFSENFFCFTIFILGIIKYLGKAMDDKTKETPPEKETGRDSALKL